MAAPRRLSAIRESLGGRGQYSYVSDHSRMPALLYEGRIPGRWHLPRLWQETFRRRRRSNEDDPSRLSDFSACSLLHLLRCRDDSPRCRFESYAFASQRSPRGDRGGFRLLPCPYSPGWVHWDSLCRGAQEISPPASACFTPALQQLPKESRHPETTRSRFRKGNDLLPSQARSGHPIFIRSRTHRCTERGIAASVSY
jgi:hypothetical protein